MQKEKRKNKNRFILMPVLFFLILIFIFLVYIQINNFFILGKVKIYTEAIAGENPGFDLNISALTFGKVVPGNGASRDINIKNNFDKDARVEIISRGEISDFIIVSENYFVLIPQEEKKISFSVFFPKNTKMKKYNGEIEIKLKNV